jgi:DNA-directed RNA polymerase sigma subunit (sigma70/sigma32)
VFDGSIEVLGLPPARVISERDSEVVRMRQRGATIGVIARRFEISRVRVRQILDRDGW